MDNLGEKCRPLIFYIFVAIDDDRKSCTNAENKNRPGTGDLTDL